ncbi:hypothetical protein LCGC14_2419170 [marine sediment metagenome]|uniref:Uncharacterized protein n=1 Tax=marine sediment metagenome TaxID=412755 RepID=A0A0F9CCC3_9ZZZZ
MNLEDITFEDFQAYEKIRKSGITNMMSPDVQDLAGISKEIHFAIMRHYEALCDKYPTVRD